MVEGKFFSNFCVNRCKTKIRPATFFKIIIPVAFCCGDSGKYVLNLNKNVYGLKNASLNCFNLLKEGLEACGYKRQSAAHACVILGNISIVLVYVNDCVEFQQEGGTD